MKLVIEINLDNAAFHEEGWGNNRESAAILEGFCHHLKRWGHLRVGETVQSFHDKNGNFVGNATVVEEVNDAN